jgi:hypothetical protein
MPPPELTALAMDAGLECCSLNNTRHHSTSEQVLECDTFPWRNHNRVRDIHYLQGVKTLKLFINEIAAPGGRNRKRQVPDPWKQTTWKHSCRTVVSVYCLISRRPLYAEVRKEVSWKMAMAVPLDYPFPPMVVLPLYHPPTPGLCQPIKNACC